MAKTRSKLQRAKDLLLVESLALSGVPQYAIAEQIGVSRQTILRDLKTLEKRWKDSAVRDLDAAKGKELAKLDNMEAEAWRSFRRSRAGGAAGDSRFLGDVQWCIDRRCKLLGIDAPVKQELSGGIRILNIEDMTDEELKKYASERGYPLPDGV
jgi:hypothetical protein